MKSMMTVGMCVLMLGVIAGGCNRGGVSEKLTEVTGTVTLDDQPVAGLQVMFEPKDQTKPSSVGYTKADGTYRLTTAAGEPGAVAGTHIVRITSEESDEGPARAIPNRYNTSSELTCEVGDAPLVHDVKLTSS